ncbi:ABC transporter permease [Thermofilum pendens]|nr:ABC transporter permease [Thermofilum pendens]
MELLKDLRAMYMLVLWDLSQMKRRTVFVVMRVAWFALQVTVFGLAMNAIVRFRGVVAQGIDYYHFYLFGVYASMLFSISVSKAYDVAEEFEEGMIEYLLSLPMKRKILSLGRSIGGGLSAFLFTLPMYAVVVLLLGVYDPVAVLLSLLSALVFAVGVTGFVISVVLSLKSSDYTDIFFGVLDALIIRLSTVFYPAVVVAKIAPYYYAALVNPVSHFVDLLRTFFFFEEFKHLSVSSPYLMASYILGFAAGVSSAAIYIVEKRVEGGGWK